MTSKRVVTLILALVALAARRFNLSPDELALLLDCVEAGLVVGLGAHFGAAFRQARKALPKVGLVLLTGCTTLGGVVDRDTRTVTWRCDGRVTVRMQTGGVRVECPTGPAPLVVVEGKVGR